MSCGTTIGVGTGCSKCYKRSIHRTPRKASPSFENWWWPISVFMSWRVCQAQWQGLPTWSQIPSWEITHNLYHMVNKGQWWSIMLDRIIYDYIEPIWIIWVSPKVTMLIMVVNNGAIVWILCHHKMWFANEWSKRMQAACDFCQRRRSFPTESSLVRPKAIPGCKATQE